MMGGKHSAERRGEPWKSKKRAPHQAPPGPGLLPGMYTEVAFSGESLRINGRGLLFGLVVGLLVGVWGGLFARLLGAANHLREGTGWAMFLLPLAGLLVVWMYRRGGIKTAGEPTLSSRLPGGAAGLPSAGPGDLRGHPAHPWFWRIGRPGGRGPAAGRLLGRAGAQGGKLGAEFQDLAIMCGMSAGFSAVFGSQITAALFALEISCVGILPLGASFPAWSPLWPQGRWPGPWACGPCAFISPPPPPDVLFYGQVLVLGIACGLLSILVCYTFSGVRRGWRGCFPTPISGWWWGAPVSWFSP